MARPILLAVVALLALLFGVLVQRGWSQDDWRGGLARPDPEFAQMPFWFWNDELDDREIARQMAEFRAQGVYAFVIHARMGLPTSIPYMGKRWLGHVRFAVEEAARTGMRVCLYDEGMYPSGSAHGEVVRSNPAFAAQGLTVQFEDVSGPAEVRVPAPREGRHVATVIARRRGDGDGIELGAGQITVVPRQRGAAFELSTVRVPEGAWRMMSFLAVPSGGHIRGVHPGEEDGQPGAPRAADLLNPEAMKAFLRLAYDPYHEALQDHFGQAVMAMFTDEPSLLGRGARRGLQPWTDGIEAHFETRRGYALAPRLPALFFDAGEPTRQVREDFQLTLAERLDETYYGPIAAWCRQRGIALTGHPAGSDEIRPLRHFQIPGQDLVWRYVVPDSPTALEGAHSTTAKCSSSVARHDGRRRNANEVYGAYGWNLTMDEMKWLADWLMVRGVNLLYPHAFYYSIRGQRAHERPPDLGLHNAWWPHYRRFADYTSRLCKLMTDGRQVCDVAVLSVGNRLPFRAARWLLENQVDFNYLEDWRLVEQAKIEPGRLGVGPMTYRVLIVDHEQPLAGPVGERVAAFERAGGVVRVCRGAASADLVAGLERDVTLDPPSRDLRYAHVVKHGVDFYLWVNEGERPIDTTLTCRARGNAQWYDPWADRFLPATVLCADATIQVPLHLPRRESLVLAVDPRLAPQIGSRKPAAGQTAVLPIAGPWTILGPEGKPLGDRLGDWAQWPGLAGFSGALVYEVSFELPKQPRPVCQLDLGTVGDWAVLRVNGRDLGPRFWAPMVWDVTDAVHDGKNTLRVEVTNSLANRYEPKNRRPSGLFGPVVLRVLAPP